MADLTEVQSAQFVKLVGSDGVGVEMTPILSNTNGELLTSISYTELPTFICSISNITTANNKSMIAISNTSSTNRILIKEVSLINAAITATTGLEANFQLNRFTTLTGGTTITPQPFDTTDSLPSGINGSSGSTITGEGTIYKSVLWSTDEFGAGTADAETTEHSMQTAFALWQHKSGLRHITLRQNQGLHIKCATNTTSGTFNLSIIFSVI